MLRISKIDFRPILKIHEKYDEIRELLFNIVLYFTKRKSSPIESQFKVEIADA